MMKVAVNKAGYSVLIVYIILSLLFIVAAGDVHAFDENDFNSKAALLMDFDSAEIIISHKEQEQLFPASITKIMTLLLVLEALERGEISLNDEVPITRNAAAMGGTQLFLSQGDVVDMESLIIGIAVGSANDAAVAVAEYISGSEGAFVDTMNRRALELKMSNTNFVNPTGLHHPDHYTTAYDIALMSRELLKKPLSFRWSTIWMDEKFLEGRIRSGMVYLSNTNHLVRLYRGCDGIKTGYTREAGHSIAATAKRNDTRFIAVVLGVTDSESRYHEAIDLLDYAFANYSSVYLKDANEVIATLPVEKGSLQEVNIITAERISFLLKKGEEISYDTEIILPRALTPPLRAGEKAGEFIIKQGEQTIKSFDLIVARDVEEATFTLLLRRYLEAWLNFGQKK